MKLFGETKQHKRTERNKNMSHFFTTDIQQRKKTSSRHTVDKNALEKGH